MGYIKNKIPLDKFSYSVRAAHLINQYGVGAMVNFRDQVLMTAAPKTWSAGVFPIYEERLQKKLGVDYFGLPFNQDEKNISGAISYVRFPQWYFCPQCHCFMPIKDWIKAYRNQSSKKEVDEDPYMMREPHCPSCSEGLRERVRLVVARLVTICEHGHINDFPWVKWAHRNVDCCCEHPSLTIYTKKTGTYSFGNIVVKCLTCQAESDLSGVMAIDLFETIDKQTGRKDFLCQGGHPWKNSFEECSTYPRAVLRGASSVYFPVEESSLAIPPYETEFKNNIRNTVSFRNGMENVNDTRNDECMPQEEKEREVKKYITRTAGKIVQELGSIMKEEDIKDYLQELWRNDGGTSHEPIDMDESRRKSREEEYDALTGEAKGADKEGRCDFVREELEDCRAHLPFLSQVVLIHKLREVRALVGFSRVNPVKDMADKEHFVNIKDEKTRFYPGYQVFGEGIFMRFDSRQIALWEADNELSLRKREKMIDKHFHQSFFGQGSSRQITAKGILLHSFAHALIRQLSFECGYSISSLRERLYYDQEDGVGKDMSGILIYTASGDSEGTMGGLVRQGYMETLPKIIKKAINTIRHCSNDPICSLSHGQGRFAMNLAACHACMLLPETSCEEFNSLLDRAMLIGTMEEPEIGFFSQGYDTYTDGKDVVPRNTPVKRHYRIDTTKNAYQDEVQDGEFQERHVLQPVKTGAVYDGENPDEVWESLLEDCEDDEDEDGVRIFQALIDRHMSNIPRSYYAGRMKDCETGQSFEFNQCFKEKHIFIFTAASKNDYLIARQTGWSCYLVNRDFDIDRFIQELGGD